MGSFNACFGIGTFTGAGIGTLAAAANVPVADQFAATSLVLLAAFAVIGRWLPPETAPAAPSGRTSFRRRFTPQLRALSLLAGLGQLISTTLELWAAYYVAHSLGAGAAAGAATYTAMSIVGILALLGVDRIVGRFGNLRVFQVATAAAAVTLGTGLGIGTAAAVITGLIIFSIGTACAGPSIYSFASQQHLVPAAEPVTVIELGDSVGALISPALIGGLATLIGLSASLATIPAAATLMLLLARRAATTAVP